MLSAADADERAQRPLPLSPNSLTFSLLPSKIFSYFTYLATPITLRSWVVRVCVWVIYYIIVFTIILTCKTFAATIRRPLYDDASYQSGVRYYNLKSNYDTKD